MDFYSFPSLGQSKTYCSWNLFFSIICSDCYVYITSGRADSMKEAVNLFEDEQHRNRMEQGMADMQAQYQAEIESMSNKMEELETAFVEQNMRPELLMI